MDTTTAVVIIVGLLLGTLVALVWITNPRAGKKDQ